MDTLWQIRDLPTVAQASDLCLCQIRDLPYRGVSLRLVFMANQRFAPQWRKSPTCADMKKNFVTGLLALFALSTSVPDLHLLYHSFFILRGKSRSWMLCGN